MSSLQTTFLYVLYRIFGFLALRVFCYLATVFSAFHQSESAQGTLGQKRRKKDWNMEIKNFDDVMVGLGR